MCGLNGFFNLGRQTIADPLHLIRRMNNVLEHRGPDDEGVWSCDSSEIVLGHRRLSIIDVSSAGHQPMESRRGNVIVFNGEVYNYAKLRNEIGGEPYVSNSDTEVVLRMLENKGAHALNELNGMFALAMWDARNKTLTLARDRVGIKPLYYTQQNGIFAFSSEIRSLLELPWVEKSLDHEALYHFLTFSKLSAPQSMFLGIQKMLPGHCMRVSKSGIEDYGAFWDIEYRDLDRIAEVDASTETLRLLRKSVKERMVSDVPVGAFLSGGVDSSAVVALMREHQPESTIKTFSIGFENQPDYDELSYSRAVAERFGTDHHERIISATEITDFMPKMANIFDEPLADPTSIPIHFISNLAKSEGIKVVLTGDGADEVFCGYRTWLRYVHLYRWYEHFLKSPRFFRRALSLTWSKFSREGVVPEMLHRAAEGQELFWGGANAFKESVKRELLVGPIGNLDSYSQIRSRKLMWESLPKNGRRMGPIDWMCYLGVKSIVPDYYLHRADRLGMANSIELRVPFLDHRLVDYGISLPGHLKIKNDEPKYILKRALEGLLPREILYRKKMGFCVPIEEWGADIMFSFFDEYLSEFCRSTEMFNEDYLRRKISAFRKGKHHNVHALWNFYFLMSWYRRWMA